MKNIHVIPTRNASRLISSGKEFNLLEVETTDKRCKNIYITNDEEIKDGDWICRTNSPQLVKVKGDWNNTLDLGYKKIILTDNKDLIDDGVQTIDDEFLEWFVKNQSCEEIEVQCRYNFYVGQDLTHYKIIIPKKEPKQTETTGKQFYETADKIITVEKQETLEETAERLFSKEKYPTEFKTLRKAFISSAKWQQERSYSKEEVNEIIAEVWNSCEDNETNETFSQVRKRILEQFKKK